MKVTVTLIVIVVLGTVTNGLVQGLNDWEIRGRMETILTLALLISAIILRRIPKTWEDLLLFKFQRIQSANAAEKIFLLINNNK